MLERVQVDDPRTMADMSELYQSDCVTANGTIFGVGATLDSTGNTVNRGIVNNSLILEISTKTSIMLTTMAFAILARELVIVEPSASKEGLSSN